jgi:two-component system, cell cycle response regulator
MAHLPLVLIVDDSARNRRLAADLLGLAQLRTLQAGTAAEAVALASEHLPDVILMDLRLPDRDGSEAARALRAAPRTQHIPIVAVTAVPVDPRDGWLLEAGFAGVIAKPIDIDTFAELVRGFCARSSAQPRGVPASPATRRQAR